MDRNVVYCGDWMDNTLPDKSVQLIIADPPYFEIKGHFDYVWPSFDAYLADVERWAVECKRVLADNGTLFWWGHSKKIAYSQIVFDKHFELINSMVWRKPDSMQYQYYSVETARCFTTHNERVLMYSNECGDKSAGDANKSEREYKFQLGMAKTRLMEPIVSYMIGEMEAAGLTCDKINELTGTKMASHWFARTSQWALPTRQWYDKLRVIFNEHGKPREYLKKDYEDLKKDYEDLRRPFNNQDKLEEVLMFGQESHITRAYKHPTKKALSLTRALVRTCSRPGDLVLVPFSGSGTECEAAAIEGRDFIGFDIEQKYVDMANDRVRPHLTQPNLFYARTG